MTVPVRVLREDWADPDVSLPTYATKGAAGADLRANLKPNQRANGVLITPLGRALVSTGLIVEIPEGYELQLRPRSGMALKHGITLPNTPGTIDSDYRGPLGVILMNLGSDPFTVLHGERIAQAVLAPVTLASYELSDILTDTERGQGGFGSTGRG